MYSFHQKLQIQHFISFQRKSLFNVDKAGSKVSKNIEICSKNPFSKIKFIFTASSHKIFFMSHFEHQYKALSVSTPIHITLVYFGGPRNIPNLYFHYPPSTFDP